MLQKLIRITKELYNNVKLKSMPTTLTLLTYRSIAVVLQMCYIISRSSCYGFTLTFLDGPNTS